MARADLYKIAQYAIKLHEMLKGVLKQKACRDGNNLKLLKRLITWVQCIMQWITKINLKVLTKQKKKCVQKHVAVSPSECSGPDCSHCDCYTENKTAKGKKLMAGAGTTSQKLMRRHPQQPKLESKSSFTSEGKSPKKRFQEIQKTHGGKHASMAEDYKAHIPKRLNEALADIAETASS